MLKTKRIRQTIEKQIKSHLKLVGIAKVKRNLQLKSKSKSKSKKYTHEVKTILKYFRLKNGNGRDT